MKKKSRGLFIGLLLLIVTVTAFLLFWKVPCGGRTEDGGHWDGVCSYGYVLFLQMMKQEPSLTIKTSENWLTYQNSIVPFTFKYPAQAKISEEFYPSMNLVHIELTDNSCSLVGLENSTPCLVTFSYIDDSENIPETDIRNYLGRLEKKSQEELDNGGIPSTPGFHWQFVELADQLFSLKKTYSAARVEGFPPGFNEYVLLQDNTVVEVKFPSEIALNDTVKEILKSINLN
ncbi:MAG: hypothetical protein ACOZAK_03305 [Patescibacteria group bacterium]